MRLIEFAYAGFALLLLPYFAYLGLVVIAALVPGRRHPVGPAGASNRFLILIPAHDEQEGIASTVASCRAVAYDPSRYRVLVVADNCTDATADAARAAGAEVLERHDTARRSKGYAIEDVLDGGEARDVDAVVIVDADTAVDTGLLATFDAAIDAGHDWIQAYYTVRNADSSWRTRLMTYAFSLLNGVLPLGQDRLGLGAGLKGNGMCFTTRGLRRVPWRSHGLVEDMEFSWTLHSHGERVHFAPGARVFGEMVSRGGPAASAQRRRWEAGRRAIPRRFLATVLRSPSLGPARKLLSAIQMTLPPLVTLVALLLACMTIHPTSWIVPGIAPLSRLLAPIHATMAAVLVAYLISPVLVMGLPSRHLADLIFVPYYAAWKLAVSAGRAPTAWVRTRRETSRAGRSVPPVDSSR